MRKIAPILLIAIILILSGCSQKYRIYNVALLDVSPQEEYGMTEIADTFRVHSVNVIGEDSLANLVGENELTRVTTQLCAAYRQDRLKSALAFAKEVEVDAIVFSSMPPVGLKTNMPPCLSDSLISFFLVEPPKVLFEARTYEDFIYNMSSINWEVVVSSPPKPKEFKIALGEEIEFARLVVRVVRNEGHVDETHSKTEGNDEPPKEITEGNKRADGSASETQEKLSEDKQGGDEAVSDGAKWLLVIEDRFHAILLEPFTMRVVGKIPGKIEYDISTAEDSDEPTFKAVLTNLRIE
ncbi:MAG: hypothetical protein ACP5G4_02200 [bacterium]